VFQIVIGIFGFAAAAIYVGYLAYAIGRVPLWIIVVATLALAIRELVTEFRDSADRETRRRGS
jgi:predicted membrane metal-binding protein